MLQVEDADNEWMTEKVDAFAKTTQKLEKYHQTTGGSWSIQFCCTLDSQIGGIYVYQIFDEEEKSNNKCIQGFVDSLFKFYKKQTELRVNILFICFWFLEYFASFKKISLVKPHANGVIIVIIGSSCSVCIGVDIDI